MMTTSDWPCDSPAVKNLNISQAILSKFLPRAVRDVPFRSENPNPQRAVNLH
jgi:hypothetical protein